MPQKPQNIALAFVNAINQHDTDELCGLMPDEHRFIDSLGGTTEGREKMRNGWAGYFEMFPDYAVCVEEITTNGSTVIMLGTARGTYVRKGEQLMPENLWQMPAAWRALIQDEKVLEWQVYADNEPVRRILANKLE